MSRAVVFRVAAIVFGLLLVVGIEVACRFADVGQPQLADDPFVGFSATRPLFVLNDDGTRYEIAPGRLTHFRPDSFAAVQGPDEFRVFCLGGSTVQGRPFSIETSFTKFVELGLQAADPSRTFKVVNCGGVSYATYRLVPILEEVLQYQPDLIILCEGHNEFLEDRTYAEIKHASGPVAWVHEQAARLHVYNVMREAMQSVRSPPSAPAPRTTLGPEVDARLDWRGGLNAYHRDPAWQRECVDHFAFNIHRAIAIAEEHHVPLLLVNPAANLDWPPFKAEHREGLGEADLARVDELWEEARTLYRDDRPRALGLLKQAAAIDSQHAGLQFDLGKCYQSLGLLEQARAVLVRAKDLDICPLRILEPMHAIILDSARKSDTMLVDADALFASRSPGGINGAEWFVDHVHPSIEGHQLLADAILTKLVELRFVKPSASWEADKARACREHLDALPANYYSEGMRRLKSEQGWAHGRATKRHNAGGQTTEDTENTEKRQQEKQKTPSS